MIFNKKGQFLQVTIGIVFLVLLAIVSVFVFNVSDSINDAIQVDRSLNNQSKDLNDNLNTAYPSLFDGILAFVFVGLWLASIVAAFNSDGNAFWAVLAIVIIAILGFVGMALSNVWDEIDDDPKMNAFTNSMPMTDFIMTYYLQFVLVMGFSTLIVLLTRSGGGL